MALKQKREEKIYKVGGLELRASGESKRIAEFVARVLSTITSIVESAGDAVATLAALQTLGEKYANDEDLGHFLRAAYSFIRGGPGSELTFSDFVGLLAKALETGLPSHEDLKRATDVHRSIAESAVQIARRAGAGLKSFVSPAQLYKKVEAVRRGEKLTYRVVFEHCAGECKEYEVVLEDGTKALKKFADGVAKMYIYNLFMPPPPLSQIKSLYERVLMVELKSADFTDSIIQRINELFEYARSRHVLALQIEDVVEFKAKYKGPLPDIFATQDEVYVKPALLRMAWGYRRYKEELREMCQRGILKAAKCLDPKTELWFTEKNYGVNYYVFDRRALEMLLEATIEERVKLMPYVGP